MPEQLPQSYLELMALRIILSDGGELSAPRLVRELAMTFAGTGIDIDLPGVVRTFIASRDSSDSAFAKGYAIYNPATESIRITEAGAAYIEQLPE